MQEVVEYARIFLDAFVFDSLDQSIVKQSNYDETGTFEEFVFMYSLVSYKIKTVKMYPETCRLE